MRKEVAILGLGVMCCFGVSLLNAQTLDSSLLPILVIDLSHENIPDKPKVVTQLRIIDSPGDSYNYIDGPSTEYAGNVGIERRGASSQNRFPKVGYGLELRSTTGEDTSAVILGMPEEEDWVLHGPYSDKTLIRNAFTYSLTEKLMDYAPRTRFVELVLGDDYRGVYLLTERIKRDKSRVDISKLKADDLSGDELTGGYLLKFDKINGSGFRYDFELPAVNLPDARPSRYLLHYPKSTNIQAEQLDYISGWFEEFERRLASPNFDDPILGYLPLVDLNSFVDFFLVNEATKNVDGYRISTFFYKDRDSKGGKLHMGPVWDFNLALANADYCEGSQVEGWMIYFADYCPDDFYYAPFWWPRLMESQHFQALLASRYEDLRSVGPLSVDALNSRFDSLLQALPQAAIDRNFVRWPNLGEYTWPNAYVPNSHADAVRHMKAWLTARMQWMDGEIARLVSTETQFNDDLELAFAPNPGSGNSIVTGLSATDYPLDATWINSAGQVISQHTVGGPQDWQFPKVPGIYTCKIGLASGQIARLKYVAL